MGNVNDGMVNDRDIEKDSDYPPIEIPRFVPVIPDHLLGGLSPEMRYLVEQSSIQSQSQQWLCEKMRDTNLQVRKTNGRLKKVENWKEKLTSFTSLSLFGAVTLSAILGLILKIISLWCA